MTDRSVLHSTFELERTFAVPPEQVFAAWSDTGRKARWFVPNETHELDFRVGGREVNRNSLDDGTEMTFESFYRDIVDGERIVFTSVLSKGDTPVTVSLTTVVLRPTADGTELRLTEQDAFLDGHEQPSWREQGTSDWLGALGDELKRHAGR